MLKAPKTFKSNPVLLLGLILPVGLVLQILGFHDLRHDDAYITYRYGQNLAMGQGLVFNPGERIMGSTSPAHCLLAGLLYLGLGKDNLMSVMSSIGCIGWTAQAAASYFLFRRAIGPGLALFLALCILAGLSGSASWVALETNLVVAMTLWAFWFSGKSRWTETAVLCALAGLMRPDAFLLPFLFAVPCFRELKRKATKPALIFLALCIPWLIFSFIYYGSPIPQSAVAKVQTATFTKYLSHVIQHPIAETLFEPDQAWHIVAGWLIFATGAASLIIRDRRRWTLVAYGILHLAAYAFLRPPPPHTWHLYPGVVVFSMMALSSITCLSLLKVPQPAARIVAASGLMLIIGFTTSRTFDFANAHKDEYWFGARDRAYRGIAEYLTENAEPRDRVATNEIGTVGYYSRLPVYDLGDLVTRRTEMHPEDLRWIMLDKNALRDTGGRTPVHVSQSGPFTAVLFEK